MRDGGGLFPVRPCRPAYTCLFTESIHTPTIIWCPGRLTLDHSSKTKNSNQTQKEVRASNNRPLADIREFDVNAQIHPLLHFNQ